MRKDNPSISVADLESVAGDATLGAEGFAPATTPVCIHVHSVRKRLADSDGISAKAVIDELVLSKVLQGDSPEFVEEVRYSQQKGEFEYTIVTISGAGYGFSQKYRRETKESE